MLRELHISNLAVIEDIRLEMTPGLNVFTGQTGAGKSLILGALELLLGRGVVGGRIRPGASEGRVTGLFEFDDPRIHESLVRVADLPDQDMPTDEPVLVTRKFFASGRSSASINGVLTTTGMLRRVSEHLVDLHAARNEKAGRNADEGQYLLRPSNQLDVLDTVADLGAARERFRADYARWREARGELEEFTTGESLRREQLDLYEFQADEIDRVEPIEGEFEEFTARHQVLSNMERIVRDAGAVAGTIYEDEGAIVERLQWVVAVLREITEIDPDLAEVTESAESATALLQDAAYTLTRYLGRSEHDPNELAEVNDRLNALNRLIAKYGEAQIEEVLAYRESLATKMERLRSSADGVEPLRDEIASLEEDLRKQARAMRRKRQKAATTLKPQIESELAELAMKDAEFEVRFEDAGEFGPSGNDEVEFMLRTNPGQPMMPLRQIASGGELSRIMLALKTVLAGAEGTSVLVFDEIDAKIGGRLGTVIGSKLQALARRHQVLCITHLPQIAAFADNHLKIEKHTDGVETRTTVHTLRDEESRERELAEMLAGKDASTTTMTQARELRRTAQAADTLPAVTTPRRKRKSQPN